MTQAIRWLQNEIADRMLQKLDIVKLNARDVLVVPDFPGEHLNSLSKRFPGANIFSITEDGVSNLHLWRSKVMANWRSAFSNRASPLVNFSSTGRFNLPDNSVDLVFSDLLLQDLSNPKQFLQECYRVLREGGLLSFSYLGPDTGKELLPLNISGLKRINLLSPWDMHDMGDASLAERFSDPVMDMEYLTLDYENSALLLDDLGALKLILKPTAELDSGVVLPKKLTLEVVYGHAWALGKHLAKAQDNVAYVDVNQIQRKTR